MRIVVSFLLVSIPTSVYAQTAGSVSGASSSINISNPASTKSRLITTPTVVAPGLAAAGVETCLGSAAAGVSVMGGGFTFGSTKVDEGCTIRLLARQLFAFGFQKAAVTLMCQDKRVAAAMDAAGSPCPFPPVTISQSDRDSFVPALSFTVEEPAKPFAQGAQVKPFTQEEQALFARASNMN